MAEVPDLPGIVRSHRFGQLLASHRRHRSLSQQALALDADVSARHLSFLEIGRARPSVDMVRRLAAVLGLTRVERDTLLLAAGYAPEAAPTRLTLHGSEGADAFAAALALGSAETPEAAVEIAANAFSALGVQHFISGVIHRTPQGYTIERDGVGRPAVGWLRYMQLRDYHRRDYLPAAAFARSRGFFWSEVSDAEMTSGQRRILNEAQDFRIGTGFVLPIHQPDRSVRAFSSWAERLDSAPATRMALSLVAGALLDALDSLGTERSYGRGNRLRAEHREVLLRVSEGGSDALDQVRSDLPLEDLLSHAVAVMGMRCPVAAAGRAAALGLLD